MRKAEDSNIERSAGRKDLASYVASTMGLTASNMLANLVVMRWLEPQEAGIWQLVTLWQTYASVLQLGVFNGLGREYPYRAARGEASLAIAAAATAKTVSIVSGVIAAVGFLLAALSQRDDQRWVAGLAAVAVTTGIGFYRDYLAATFRTSQAFRFLSLANWAQAAVVAVTVLLVAWLGFAGQCMRMAVVGLAAAGFMHLWRPLRVKAGWSREALRDLLGAGAPLLALSYLITFSSGFDRLMVGRLAGADAVGLLAPAVAIKGAVGALPLALNQYVSPRLGQLLGRFGDPRRLWRPAFEITVLASLGLAAAVVVGWFAIPPVIEIVFPKYVEGIRPAQWMLASGVFTGIQAGTAALAILKSWRCLAVWGIANVGALWWIPLAFTKVMGPLEGVALGWLVARAVLAVVGVGLVYAATHSVGSRNEVLVDE